MLYAFLLLILLAMNMNKICTFRLRKYNNLQTYPDLQYQHNLCNNFNIPYLSILLYDKTFDSPPLVFDIWLICRLHQPFHLYAKFSLIKEIIKLDKYI